MSVIYWRIIFVSHDVRFLNSALLHQALWIGVWVCVSDPLTRAWRQWQQERTRILNELRKHSSSVSVESTLAVLHEIQPIRAWAIVGSLFVSISSFIAPVLQALIS